MRGRQQRAFAAIALSVAIAVGACGGGDEVDTQLGEPVTEDRATTTEAPTDTTAATSTSAAPPGLIEVVVVGGAPQGGVRREAVALGETVTLRVTADADDEVHVHGYDLELDVGGNRPADLVFEATIPGVFEIELHESGREIVRLQVGG